MSDFIPEFPGDTPLAAAIRRGCEAKGISYGTAPKPRAIFAKRHYEAVARVLHSLVPHADDLEHNEQWRATVDAFGAAFKADSKRFKLWSFRNRVLRGPR